MSASSSSIIKSLYIEDFQSHKETKIDLPGPGQLCVIVGPTDSGKTAIVRALRLLCYNAPSGVDYIRVGRDKATVAVEMADGIKVARERSRGSINRYRVTKPGQSAAVLEGFGGSVPHEVQEVTGVRVVSIGETLDLALNLSEQLDGPFLGKTVSAPAKAKILGALAGTEEVDQAQKDLGTDLHRAGQEANRLADEVARLADRIAEYDYLPTLAERVEALEALLAAAKIAQAKTATLEGMRSTLETIAVQRASTLGILARWGGLVAATTFLQSAQDGLRRSQALEGHRTSLKNISTEQARWHPIAHVRWAGLDEAAEMHRTLEQASARRRCLEDLQGSLAITQAGLATRRGTLSRWIGLQDAQAVSSEVNNALVRLSTLSRLRAELQGIIDAQILAGRQYGRWHKLGEAAQVAQDVPAVTERLDTLTRASNALIGIRRARVVAENDLSKHSKALGDAQALYAETLVALGTCPTCGSRVSPESIKSHIEEVA